MRLPTHRPVDPTHRPVDPTPGRWTLGLAVALALGLFITACGGDQAADIDPAEVEALREQVASLTERDTLRDQRLDDLESVTARLTRTDPTGRIADTERELAQLLDTLTNLDEELEAAITDNAQRDAEVATTTDELATQNAALLEANEQLRATVGELRGQLDGARGRIDRVSGEVEDLEIRYATLRDRLDRLGR